jgi:hypothetical protein
MFSKKTHLQCCLILFSFFSSKLSAQIIYTDIVPDATPSATYSLDLNNDTIPDFLIQFDSGAKLMCKPQNNNAYAGETVFGINLLCAGLITWFDASNPGTMASGAGTGHWIGQTDKYLALKLNKGVNTYYGWARIDVIPTSSSFTIKDYAYESTPHNCIQAGAISLGFEENIRKPIFSVLPNPFNNITNVQINQQLSNANIAIYNSCGQMVKQLSLTNTEAGQNISFSREQLPSGYYFIRLADENKIIAVDKIVITD